jgi:glycosyltransferase involved in cell wall biosynthesis
VRILVHDYSGHPFQAQLSRELSRRGHHVTHSYYAGWPSGKGDLTAAPGEAIVFEPIGVGVQIDKQRFLRRLALELRWGFELARQVRRTNSDVALVSNAQIPTLVVFSIAMLVIRRPWILWHQDVYAEAVRSFAGRKLSGAFRMVATGFDIAERWTARRAAAIIAIAPSFIPVHERWGTAHKTTVVPNWAPLDEILPLDRKNDWSVEQRIDNKLTLLYSGTLGLKHNPRLLVQLTRQVIDYGQDVELVVVNNGPATAVLRDEAARLDVPLQVLPFQPYDRLSEVLSSGDILVVLLDQEAGAFSVPSKTQSYLCAGRPVLGLMPSENLAADLITRAGSYVAAPQERALPDAARWCADVLADPARRQELGARSREVAEREFALSDSADRFEALLAEATTC